MKRVFSVKLTVFGNILMVNSLTLRYREMKLAHAAVAKSIKNVV